VLQSIPEILERVGYSTNFLFLVVNLSSSGMLVQPHIVIDCVRTGLASGKELIVEEVYQLVSHFVAMSTSADQHPVLPELIKWNWQAVLAHK